MIATEQAYHSNNTSINQIPALHKTVMKHGLFRCINFDNGAGKYINATNILEESLVLNVRFDPFNLSKEVNENAYRYRGLCDTSTIANVLNVIKEESVQLEVLRRSHAMVKENGFVFISVYEGSKTGIGRQTKKDCWQNNKRLAEYLPLVKKVFSNAQIKYNMIIALK